MAMKLLAKPIPDLTEKQKANFSQKIDKTSGCWNWTGALDGSGYGHVRLSGSGFRAHRVALKLFGVEPSKHDVVDHKCRNTKCVNPDHLRLVDFHTNLIENSNGQSALNKQKTHCPQNHAYDEENTHMWNGIRYCKACNRVAVKKRDAKKRQCVAKKEAGL